MHLSKLSCEREVGNIHNTFAAKDGEGSHRFQASELVMTPSYYESHETEAFNSVIWPRVWLCTC